MFRRVLAGLCILAVIGAGAVYRFLSGDGVRLALERQASAWLGQPVRIGTAQAQLFPRVGIRLGNARVGEPVRLTLADIEVSTGLRALLSRRIEDAEITIANSRLDMPLPFTVLHEADTPSDPANQPGSSITVASVRAIGLRDILITSRGREILISAESSLVGNRLNLARFSASAGGTSIDASGIIEWSPRLVATLQASANRLDLDDLLALADAFSTQSSPSGSGKTELPGRIQVKISAAKGTAAGVEVSRLATNLVMSGTRVTLSPATFELFGGRYEGALDVNVRDNLGVALTSRVFDLDVAQLAAFGGVAGSITGRLSGNGRFKGRGRDLASVLAAANGGGSAAITQGTIRRLDLVRTVVLFFGRPAADAAPSAGERFEQLISTFTLERQVLAAKSLMLHSPDLDVAATGTLTIPTKALDVRGELLLSESLSAQAGTDLYRYTREGNRVVLPVVIGGTLDRPSVRIDAAAAVKRGLRNEVERRLKGLFDRIKPPSEL